MLWEDGTSAWEGLPLKLHNKLNWRQKLLAGVEQLSCGPAGEWFVRFLDGSWQACGLSTRCDNVVDELQRQGYDISNISFGKGWSWAIQYCR